MATLNFPDAPDTGDIYFDSNSGFTYEWNGEVWISRGPSTIPSIKELDNISGSFNGSTTTFNLTSSSVAVSPATAQQLVINIGNVMQNAGDDYTVSGSTITFTTAPLAGYAFQGTVLGNAFSLGTVVDGTVSPSSLDTSDSYNVGGITVTGITTVTDFSFSGITTVANLEPADMDISGIGTVSNIIMTKDAAGLGATMGAAVGVVTYFGDGSNLTGLGLTFFPISYDPGISSTSQPVGANITLDWNHPVKAGSGTITIREGSVSGTVVDQFVVGTSSSISFVNNQVILNPAASLGFSTSFFINFPAGSIKSYGDLYQNGQVTYSFDTKDQEMYLYMWGYGGKGNLAQNNTTQYSSPVQVDGNTWSSVSVLSSAYGNTQAIKSDGTAWVWGDNQYGMLGLSQALPYHASSPIQLPGTTWKAGFSGAPGTILSSKTDGTLWVRGYNYDGQLGLHGGSYKVSPVQLPGTNWTGTVDTLAAGHENTAAIKTDGTLWMWGKSQKGEGGFNTISKSSPTQVGTDTTWRNVKILGRHTLATKTDNTLWSWGYNYYGSLGHNNAHPTGTRSSPVQIPGTNWKSAGQAKKTNYNSYALKNDGTLWGWGRNEYGELGQNSRTDYSSPVQVGTDTTWSDVGNGTVGGSGCNNMAALKTDGTVWTWGVNSGDQDGGLGQNNIINYSSPVQVPGTSWESISVGSGVVAAIQAEG